MRVCPGCRVTFPDTASECAHDGLPLIDLSPTFAAPSAKSAITPAPVASGEGPIQPELRSGMMVGAYRVERLLATGGMGSIYAGIHPVISKRVAIKVLDRRLQQEDPTTLARFVLEARSVNQIGHHNIVDIFSIGELDDGRAYLVMELLDGLPLHHLLRRLGSFEPGLLVPLYQQLCDALQAAHGKSFVHRDLKPDNIVVLRRPPHPFIKILDFGIAKLRHGSSGERTAVGTVLGTPEYMAPEQCRGDEVDGRADIYALGVMLYELVTGKKPFRDPNPMRVLAMQLRRDPEPPSKLKEIPAALETLILKAMAKAPQERYASVAELLAALLSAVPRPSPWALDLSPLDGSGSAQSDAELGDAPTPLASEQPPPSLALEVTTRGPEAEALPDKQAARSFLPQLAPLDVPAPLMISSEFAFNLDELSRLAPDDEEQTVTVMADVEDDAAAATSEPPPLVERSTLPGVGPGGAAGTEPRTKTPSSETPRLRNTPAPLPAVPKPEVISESPALAFVLDDGYDDDVYPDEMKLGQTAIEEGALLEALSGELVIERSLLEQTESARSAHQASMIRRTETGEDKLESSDKTSKKG